MNPEPAKRYRSAWLNGFMFLVWMTFLLVSASMIWQPDEPRIDLGARVLGIVIAAFCVPSAIRALRAGVIVSGQGVVIRKLFYTRRFRWDQVFRFSVHHTSSIIPWFIVAVERIDGKKTLVPEIGSLGFLIPRPASVDRVVEALSHHLNQRGASASKVSLT